MTNFADKTKLYRPDIDGLRSIAVISVLFFHLDINLFSGGFVGVDVFFVISGYLITRNIKNEYNKNGSFSFSNFYMRRARRLFPAFFFTLILTFILSFLLLSPAHFNSYGKALFYAAVSITNLKLWKDAGYFDVSSSLKPLLHTWSLSVEEQFYLIWPVVIIIFLKSGLRHRLPIVLFVLSIVNLYFCHLFLDGAQVYVINQFLNNMPASDTNHLVDIILFLFKDGNSAVFYITPFRFFEFAIGAIIVWLVQYQPKNILLSELAVFSGIILIFTSITIYNEETPFPSYSALVPCVGAALIIHSGSHSRAFGMVLNNRTTVGIGLISYSLYLIHWPLIMFYKYYTHEALTITEQSVIVILSIASGSLMYRYIEQPFRKPSYRSSSKGNILFVNVSVILTLLAITTGLHISSNNGWSWRTSESVTINLADLYEVGNHEKHIQLDKNIRNRNPKSIFIEIGSGNDILIIGDSHATQYKWMANYLYEELGIGTSIYASGGCPPIFKTYKIYDINDGRTPMKQIFCQKQTKIWEDYNEAPRRKRRGIKSQNNVIC